MHDNDAPMSANCSCGCPDDYMCQRCGQVKCSACHPSTWRPDITGNKSAGNVCPGCLKRHMSRGPWRPSLTDVAHMRHVGRGKTERPALVKVFPQWSSDRTTAMPIEISHLLSKLLKTSRQRIIEWLDLAYPDWKEHGNLDDWWGMGSVFCMELCISVDIKVNNLDETVTVTLR